MKRRDFLVLTSATTSALALGLAACGDDGDDSTGADAAPSPDGEQNSCVIAQASGTSDSHGHSLVIPKADIESPSNTSYQSVAGGHPHTVNLTAAQLTELGSGCRVTVSSNDSHSHTWTLTIA